MAEIPLTQGKFAIVDDEDFDLVNRYKWRAYLNHGIWYAKRDVRLPGGGRIVKLLHMFLTGFAQTDHRNGDGLDNRRVNLREATRSQNNANQRKTRGSSRFKGTCWHKAKKRWLAGIKVFGRRQNLGYYTDEIDAALAYDAAARHLFGEFAALNFPGPGERSALNDERHSLTTA